MKSRQDRCAGKERTLTSFVNQLMAVPGLEISFSSGGLSGTTPMSTAVNGAAFTSYRARLSLCHLEEAVEPREAPKSQGHCNKGTRGQHLRGAAPSSSPPGAMWSQLGHENEEAHGNKWAPRGDKGLGPCPRAVGPARLRGK